MKMIIKFILKILRKIKDIFIFYNLTVPYTEHHMSYADNVINYILKNTISNPCTSADFYYIIVKTNDNRVFELWNANFPYAWLYKVYELQDKNGNDIDIHEGMTTYNYERCEIYENMRPSRNTMIKFKEWLEDNSVRFEPRR